MNVIRRILSEVSYQLGSTKAPKPDVIFLVVNSVCNLHCKMCDVGQHHTETQFYKNMDKKTDMSYGVIVELVDEVAHYQPTFAIISTEPLLYKPLYDVINYMKVNHCPVQLTTNGWLLEEHAELIVSFGVDTLYVSIDGPPEIHDQVRGREGSWQRAINGIAKIDDLKKRFDAKVPKVYINCTISQYNFDKLKEFMDSLSPVHNAIEHVVFSHLNFITPEMAEAHNTWFGDKCHATSSSATQSDIEQINVYTLDEQITKIKHLHGGFVSFVPDVSGKDLFDYYREPMKRIQGHEMCKVPWRAAQIFADGSLGISTRCFNLDLGNVNDAPLLELWNGPKMRNFRKMLQSTRSDMPACYRCCGVF